MNILNDFLNTALHTGTRPVGEIGENEVSWKGSAENYFFFIFFYFFPLTPFPKPHSPLNAVHALIKVI